MNYTVLIKVNSRENFENQWNLSYFFALCCASLRRLGICFNDTRYNLLDYDFEQLLNNFGYDYYSFHTQYVSKSCLSQNVKDTDFL